MADDLFRETRAILLEADLMQRLRRRLSSFQVNGENTEETFERLILLGLRHTCTACRGRRKNADGGTCAACSGSGEGSGVRP